jgi:hypothetical protein
MLRESDGKKVLHGDLFAVGLNGLTYQGSYELECPEGDFLYLYVSYKFPDYTYER